jgi:hypothetical protein
MEDEMTTLQLSRSEAIVLFEFLSRFSEDDVLNIEDQAEERVLWDLCCDLESKLVEPFAENYSDILANARYEVRDKES